MRLDGHEIGALTEILRIAFTRSDLSKLVRTKLEINLDETVSIDGGWKDVAYNLIDSLNREERAFELIGVIREARPKDTTLIAFCDPLLAKAKDAAHWVSADALRKAVAAFSDDFQRNYQLFKYLEASKQLHNVLHELKSFLPEITRDFTERKADPSRPVADDVGDFLEDHAKTAVKYVKDIEFPDKPPAWIARLVTAAEVIRGSDVEKMTPHVDRLKKMTLDCLGPLNEKLLGFAKHLQPGELICSLNKILAALGTNGNPATVSLRREVEEFRSLCSELDELIKAHNLCQKIDDAFHEAAGLPSVTPGELLDWSVAKESLDVLASQRKNDKKVQRTQKAAKLFEAANQGHEFQNLIEMFDDLFGNTDLRLLDVIHMLPVKAMALRAALEVFQ